MNCTEQATITAILAAGGLVAGCSGGGEVRVPKHPMDPDPAKMQNLPKATINELNDCLPASYAHVKPKLFTSERDSEDWKIKFPIGASTLFVDKEVATIITNCVMRQLYPEIPQNQFLIEDVTSDKNPFSSNTVVTVDIPSDLDEVRNKEIETTQMQRKFGLVAILLGFMSVFAYKVKRRMSRKGEKKKSDMIYDDALRMLGKINEKRTPQTWMSMKDVGPDLIKIAQLKDVNVDAYDHCNNRLINNRDVPLGQLHEEALKKYPGSV